MDNNKEYIALGSSGINISYLRYLCDSAPGFFLLLIFFIACYKNINIPFLNICLNLGFIKELNNETKIFIYVILFLLATPLGLIVNALSCFLFDGIVSYLNHLIFWNICRCKLKFIRLFADITICNPIISYYHFDDSINYYQIKSFQEFVKKSIYFSNKCQLKNNTIDHRLAHVSGSHIFSRNLSFICFLSYFLFGQSILIIFGVFLLILAAWISFYKHAHFLFDSYVEDTSN